MRKRCEDPTNNAFHNYGGRGIKVCKRWSGKNGFQNFLADMGERPPRRSLERIDNNKGYMPSNCRWATITEQARNKRNNVWVDGMILKEYARFHGVDPANLSVRLRLGQAPAEAIAAMKLYQARLANSRRWRRNPAATSGKGASR